MKIIAKNCCLVTLALVLTVQITGAVAQSRALMDKVRVKTDRGLERVVGNCTLPAKKLDLVSVFNLASCSDPQYNLSEELLVRSKATRSVSLANLLPNVSVTYSDSDVDTTTVTTVSGRTDSDTNTDTKTTTLSVTQRLLDLSSLNSYRASKSGHKSQEHNLQTAKHSLIVKIMRQYLGVLRAAVNLKSNSRTLAAIERQTDSVREKYKLGVSARQDLDESLFALDNARSSVALGESNYATALQTLASTIGYLDLDTEFVDFCPSHPCQNNVLEQLLGMSDTCDIGVRADGVNCWLKLAEEQNPRLHASRRTVEQSFFRRKSVYSSFAPTLSFSYTRTESDTGSALYSGTTDGVSNSIAFTISQPLFQGGVRIARKYEAESSYKTALWNYEIVHRDVERLIRTLYAQVTSRFAAAKAQASAVRSAETALRATQLGYNLGTRNIVELLDSERQLENSRSSSATALYDLAQTMIELKQHAGTLACTDLQSMRVGESSCLAF